MRRALVVSVLFHVILIASVALTRRNARPSAVPSAPTATVEYLESAPATGSGRRAAHGATVGPRARSWSAFAPDVLGRRLGERSTGPGDPGLENTSGWSPDQWGAGGGGGLANVIHSRAYGKLMAEIDEVLHYPRVLGARQISGVINARLTFAKDSRCAWPPRLSGAHPYLRVYVLAVLKKTCGLDTLTTMGFGAGQTVDLSFAFTLTDRPDARPDPGRVAGNVLMFERTFPLDRMGYHVGPVRGVWFVPAVSLDWGWVLEHWESWVEGRDPLRDFRQ